jgi:hypothetical protein
VFTASRAGNLIAGALAAAADVFTASETGSLRAGTRLEGDSDKVSPVTYEKTGLLAAGTALRGTRLHESAIPTGFIDGNTTSAGVDGTIAAAAGVDGGTAATALVDGTGYGAGVDGISMVTGSIE